MKNLLRIVCEAGQATLDLFGRIGGDMFGEGVTVEMVRAQLAQVKGGKLRMNIDSNGGSVAAALAMYNVIRETGAEVTVRVQGLALSSASYLAMAADPGRLEMPSNALLAIHKPSLDTEGNADELRADAEALDRFEAALIPAYMRHFKGTEAELAEALKAETWYTAAEAASRFGAVVIGEEFKAAALLDLSGFRNVPAAALEFGTVPPPPIVATFTAEALAEHDAEVMARADGVYVPRLDAATQRAEALQARVGELEQGIKEANDREVKAIADAADTRSLLHRVTGTKEFGGDSELATVQGWQGALAKCDGDYVEARKRFPEAYAEYRRQCREGR